jgi:oxygen-independent coproporphyrinogen-3 oxidase
MIAGAVALPCVEAIADRAMVAPRYTSYPPATAFGPQTDRLAKAELARLGKDQAPLSLYVHVPFCRSLCWYCGCNVIPHARCAATPTSTQLATEMVRWRRPLGGAPVTEVALGGGSPNFLSSGALRTLAIRSALLRASRPTRGGRSSSIRETPRRAARRAVGGGVHVAQHRRAGLLRRGPGCDPPASDRSRRRAGSSSTLRAAGFDDINIDIVYGLPRQTEDLEETRSHVIELAPDRVALFGYAHLPAKLPHQRIVERAGRVPDRYERASLLLAASRSSSAPATSHLGLDHFAKPGSRLAIAPQAEKRMTRSFQGYVERRADTVIGLGVSAISSTPRMHWQNHSEVPAWQAALDAGGLPVHRGLALSHDDRIRADAITTLMCTGELDLAALDRRWDIDSEAYFSDTLIALRADADLAELDPATHTVRATPLGRVLIRNVCARFDRYHTPGTRRGSATV